MRFKEQIDQEMSHIILPEDFEKRILSISHKRERIWKYKVAPVLLCLFLAAAVIGAGYAWYHGIYINKEKLPDLEAMEKKTVRDSKALPDEMGFYWDKYENYQDLCNDLGIDLLCSDLADGNSYMLISRKTDNENWNKIRVTAYIVGDLKSISRIPGKERYRWEPGEIFTSPVDMEIDIITSDSQLCYGMERDFLGNYEFVETYMSKQNYRVQIIRDNSVIGENVKQGYRAVFVADGIRYIITGQMDLEKLKEIIDTLHH